MASPLIDPMTSSPLDMAARGSYGTTVFWNSQQSRPLLDTFTGRVRDQQAIYKLVQKTIPAMGPGHEMKPKSHRIYEPVVHQDAGEPTRAIQGLDEWTYNRGHHTGWSEFTWKYYVTPVILAEQDLIENEAGSRGVKVIDLEDFAIQYAMNKHAQKIALDLVLGDNTGAGNREMLGLAGAIPSDPTIAGTLLGGWDLSQKPDMQNQYNGVLQNSPAAGAAGDFFSQWSDFFRRMFLECRKGLFTPGISVGVMDQTTFENYESVLSPRDVVWRKVTGDGGATSWSGQTGYYCLGYKDIEFLPDWNVPVGTVYFLSFPGIKLCTMDGVWLQMRPWQDHIYQWGRVTIIVSAVQLVVGQPRAQGTIDGFTF